MNASPSRDGPHLLNGLRYLGIAVEADATQLRLNAPAGVLTPTMQAAIKAHKPALLAAANAAVAPSPQSGLPLSFEQQRVWLAQQLAPDSPEFNLALAFRIDGPLAPEALARAMTDIVRRHEILRTVYTGGAEPAQVIGEAVDVPLPIVDLRTLAEADRERVAEQIANAEIHRRFDLRRDLPLRPLLLKLQPQRHWLVISRHHIAADGWSLGLFLRELVFAYEAFRRGRPARLAAPEIQYARYAVEQRLASDEQENARHLRYWQDRLRGADPNVFPHMRRAPAATTGSVVVRQLDLAQAQRITAWCRRTGVTVFAAYLAVFLAVLRHRSGRRDLVIATDYVNRDSVERESVIGMFVRRLTLRCELQDDNSLLDLARQVKRVTFEACSHAEVPPERIARLLDRDGSGGRPQVMFGMHGAPLHAPYRDLALYGTRRAELLDLQVATNEFPLSMYVSDTAAGPVLVLRHDDAVVAKAEADMLLLQFQGLIGLLAETGDASLKQLYAVAATAEREAAANYLTMRARRFGQRSLDTRGVQQ
ncbi:condensation domain-containing protein [Xanthomonas arboricola]|uniref:condensation domain-containing protein n=1 Tax=Xanthomonas arboricola TaxID=56448 RepID=UPI000C866004|nr:condensation domain-containing protein [Xanthomonas arboricola]SOU08900.1 non-ribosomal peptide synthetase [Xanthomonas arboricola pv. fragariae]